MLENTEGTIKNGQSRETRNIVTSGTRRVNLVTNPVIRNKERTKGDKEWGKDKIDYVVIRPGNTKLVETDIIIIKIILC
jgi:hypothetical protein